MEIEGTFSTLAANVDGGYISIQLDQMVWFLEIEIDAVPALNFGSVKRIVCAGEQGFNGFQLPCVGADRLPGHGEANTDGDVYWVL